MGNNNDLFYSRIPVNNISLSDLFTREHLFYRIPENWHVIITDIKDSTEAVSKGLHETINLVATGSIVAVMNIVYNAKLTIPFFFGGDGATFIMPESMLAPALQALFLHRENIQSEFDLDMRVGHVTVSEIYNNKEELKISKLRTSVQFEIPVLLGAGLMYAEKKIKGEDYQFEVLKGNRSELNMDGMQCRWDKIMPPENYSEVISLLIIARENVSAAKAFKKVMDAIEKIYGTPQKRSPISIGKLKLKATLAKISHEMRARMEAFRTFYLLVNWIKTSLGYFYFKTKKGQMYLASLVAMSDILVIDGRINTVISGNASQRELLENTLNKLEKDGEIIYGLHVSKESVMSCYVRNMDDRHIHFVDGAEGGYTKAAGMIKQKMLQSQL
ncbi:MAG: DUF3095 family protein [Ferruginibacter sp.]